MAVLTGVGAVTTDVLLFGGVAGAVVFYAVLLVEGALRPGYDPIYHTGSELMLGDRGWIQRASFFLMGAGVCAFAFGVYRTLNSVVGAVLLAIFGLGLIVAGAFAPDPVRGYPPGASAGSVTSKPTWQATVHEVIGGPVAFIAILAACVVLARHLEGGWQLYTLITAGVGFILTVATALAFRKDAAKTGLIQRVLIFVYWSWIVTMGIYLATAIDSP